MPYDRTKTEKAALGEIDHNFYVMCGPIEVPYLAFRRSELKRMEQNSRDPEAIMDTVFDFVNYRLEGTLPREDFDEFVSLEKAMTYFVENRGGEKKPKAGTESPEATPSPSTTGELSETK